MSDPLSQVFAALADPTRRDMVARLADGDATVNELAAPYDVSVQAVSKHLKVLEDAGLVSREPGGAAPPGAPRSGGVRPDDEVDRALPPAGRGALPAPRRRARRDARRRDRPRPPTTDTAGRNSIMTTTHDHAPHRGRDRGRPTVPVDPHHPRLRRHRRRSCSGPTPTPSCSPGGSGPTRIDTEHRPTGTPATAAAGATSPRRRRRRVRASAAASTRSRDGPDRADLHLRGHARRRRPGDADLRGPRRRPHPAARASRCATRFEGRDAWLASGMETGVDEGYAKLDELLGRRRALSASTRRPAERHRAGRRRVLRAGRRRTTDWDAPGPGRRLDGPRRRRPPRRVVPRLPGRAAPASSCPAGPSVDDDPVAAWHAHADAVQALLDDPATPTGTLQQPARRRPTRSPQAIDRFYTSDVFMHTWDLARATGQDDTLDADVCAASCSPGWSRWRRCCALVGSVRPAVAVPADAARADPADRLHRPRPVRGVRRPDESGWSALRGELLPGGPEQVAAAAQLDGRHEGAVAAVEVGHVVVATLGEDPGRRVAALADVAGDHERPAGSSSVPLAQLVDGDVDRRRRCRWRTPRRCVRRPAVARPPTSAIDLVPLDGPGDRRLTMFSAMIAEHVHRVLGRAELRRVGQFQVGQVAGASARRAWRWRSRRSACRPRVPPTPWAPRIASVAASTTSFSCIPSAPG